MKSLRELRVLVTGGAGFIGSNLVDTLLEGGAYVRVFDNLETGNLSNLAEFKVNPNFEFMQGDIRSIEDCQKAVKQLGYAITPFHIGIRQTIEYLKNNE